MTSSPASKPPSERQLAYARDVGVIVPADASAAEVSDLLTAHECKGQPASPALQAVASGWGVPFTRFTCREELHNSITRVLIESERSTDLAAWYAFNVALDLGVPVTAPTDPALLEIAGQLAADGSVIRSLRRKVLYGTSWLRFGNWDDGEQRNIGASRDTAAYKAAAPLIRTKFGIAPPKPGQKREGKPTEPAAAQGAGCASVVVGFALVIGFAVAGITGAVHLIAG